MIAKITVLMALTMMMTGCAQNKPRVVSSPYASGKTQTEPVFYNGKHYRLKFKYIAVRNAYDTNIIGKGGRPLGGKPGDKIIVSSVVSSAIRHFACARGQKANILPGSARHSSGSWNMMAQCGPK